MTTASEENARTLAALLHVTEAEADTLLDVTVLVTCGTTSSSARIGMEITSLLRRTIRHVVTESSELEPDLEVIVGEALPNTDTFIRIALTQDTITIGSEAPALEIGHHHPWVELLAACYAVGAALRRAVPALGSVVGAADSTITIPLAIFLGDDRNWLTRPIDFGETYLAGAGAVGTAFLYALRHFKVRGRLHIADPDVVSHGNLNRCMWFDESDIDCLKADRLVERAQPHFADLTLDSLPDRLQAHKSPNDPCWLRRLIVAVDSRRARRGLQTELPGEVFDASTTDIREIVFHHHRAPTSSACLACIYYEAPDELSRERHVAESLGVTLAEVQEHLISSSAAVKIQSKYSHLKAADLIGSAYDSLFKALCASASLNQTSEVQVFAPFALVSVLAGAILAVETARRLSTSDALTFNYWRLSPWHSPLPELRDTRPRHARCNACSDPVIAGVVQNLWGR